MPTMRAAVSGVLEQRHQDSDRAQRPVGHAAAVEPAITLALSDHLTEHQPLLRPQGLLVHGHDSRDNGLQIPIESLLGLRRSSCKRGQDARYVAAVRTKQRVRARGSRPPHPLRIQPVELHLRQRLVHGRKLQDARRPHQIQHLVRRRRWISKCSLLDATTLDSIEVRVFFVLYQTFLSLDPVPPVRRLGDGHGEVTRAFGNGVVQANPEVPRSAGRSAHHSSKPIPAVQSFVQRRNERLGNKAHGVEKVALARAVGTHKQAPFAADPRRRPRCCDSS